MPVSLPILKVSKVCCTKTATTPGQAMAAAALTRTLQAVKPHIPSIKFPLRTSQKLKAPGDDTSLSAESMLLNNRAVQPSTSSGSSSKGPAIESSELPPRFRRKPISFEEIEYIEKGG